MIDEELEVKQATAREEEEDDDILDDETDETVVISREVLSMDERMRRRLARKPDLSKLEPAVINGEPVFDKGSRVVVERRISFIQGNPWLDTCVYTVQHVDAGNGVVQALDEEHGHRSFLSYKDGHHDFYMCPKKGNPLSKKRRRRVIVQTG